MRLWRRLCADSRCSGGGQLLPPSQVVCEECGAMAPLHEIAMPDAEYLAWHQGIEDAEANASREWERADRPAPGEVQ